MNTDSSHSKAGKKLQAIYNWRKRNPGKMRAEHIDVLSFLIYRHTTQGWPAKITFQYRNIHRYMIIHSADKFFHTMNDLQMWGFINFDKTETGLITSEFSKWFLYNKKDIPLEKKTHWEMN